MTEVEDRDDRKLDDERGRLAALRRYAVLDTPREPGFERITNLVRNILDMPICAVSLVDDDRQWFKSIQGLDATETPRSVAFCSKTIETREPLVVEDARDDPRFADNELVTGAPNIRSYAGVPLRTPDGYNLGALCVIDLKPRVFTDAQIGILRDFAALVMDEMDLRTIAHKDFLTGALTRRAFVDAASREIDRFRRDGRPCALVMFDIDHFKQINDRLGHAVGDDVLRTVAEACAAMLRPNDLLGRLGGEEFGILIPEASQEDAIHAAERLRERIATLAFEPAGLGATASFGIAALREGIDFPTWMTIADTALYDAKRAGRNRTAVRH